MAIDNSQQENQDIVCLSEMIQKCTTATELENIIDITTSATQE